MTENNLLKSTLKKSWDVSKKIIMVGVCVAAGAGVIYLSIIAASLLIKPAGEMLGTIMNGLGTIPWYVWVIAVVPLAIVVYSWLWCIQQRFTDEDITAGRQGDIGPILFFGPIFASVGIITISIIYSFLLLLLFGLALMLSSFVIAAIFIFIGAYLNYRRRTRK